MLGKTVHLEIPRRVVVYYLMFCLAAIVWLTLGMVAVSQAILNSRAERTCLSQLGKASASLTISYLRDGEAGLQSLVERLRGEYSLSYCAIVSNDRRYLAHSVPQQVGQACVEPAGAHVQWGDVERVRFADTGRRLREYRTPLKHGDRVFGTLRIAVPEPHVWETFRAAAQYAPLLVLGPMLMVAGGAVVLQKLVRPLADIESQLRRAALAPALSEVTFQPVAARSAGALGWNRLVDVLNREGQPGGLEQRLSEAVQALRQEKADDVLNSLTEGLAVTDQEGRITFANQALTALLLCDVDGAALCGKTMEACLQLDAGGEAASELLDPQLSGRNLVVELPRLRESGQQILRVARYPLRAAQGGFVWSVRDVTQQKLAEKMRDQFLDSATHELRTPLANIKAYAETLALSDVLDVENQKEFCNVINSEATRLARFIDDLLSISSMEVGSLSLALQDVDVERLLRDAISKVRPQMEQKQITFETRLPEKYPKLRLDKDKFSVALINLLGNAAKYTPAGGHVMLKVKVSQHQLQIHVEDSGMGISPEELPRVFDKFFRSSDARVQQETGTGLGLSMTHEVVRLHGGQLTVQSQVDKGSTFTIVLPLS